MAKAPASLDIGDSSIRVDDVLRSGDHSCKLRIGHIAQACRAGESQAAPAYSCGKRHMGETQSSRYLIKLKHQRQMPSTLEPHSI